MPGMTVSLQSIRQIAEDAATGTSLRTKFEESSLKSCVSTSIKRRRRVDRRRARESISLLTKLHYFSDARDQSRMASSIGTMPSSTMRSFFAAP